MSNVVIVDDDYYLELLVEHLQYSGHHVTRYNSVDQALSDIDQITKADIVLLDIIMEPSESTTTSNVSGGRNVGLNIYRRIREKNAHIPILFYTGVNESGITDIVSRDSSATFLSKWSTPKLGDIVTKVHQLLGVEESNPAVKAFIVHGHDDKTKLEVKNYLQNMLGFDEPIILHEQPNRGRTIIEKFESYSADAQVAFVIMTPDDRVVSSEASDEEKYRARQNVIFELGYFLGTMGRSSGRVVLLHKGPIDLPSDISGVIYIDITNGIEAAGEKIRKELQDVITK